MDGILTIPSTGASRFANLHVSPLSAFSGILAFAIFNLDSMSFASLSKVINILMVTGSIEALSLVPGVDGIELDDVRNINSFK